MQIIYCDGSTRINNKKGANNIGGYGYVVFDKDSNFIIDAYSKQVNNTTNNRMELMAIIEVARRYGRAMDDWGNIPTVYTDSEYAFKCFTVWGLNWQSNGWVRDNGKPIENLDLIQEGLRLLYNEDHFVELYTCKGHSGIKGNELADKLATGAMTAEEAYYSDTVNHIPTFGYFIGKNNWKSNYSYKDDPQYWITGIEDGWISPDEALFKWYKQYKAKNNKNDKNYVEI